MSRLHSGWPRRAIRPPDPTEDPVRQLTLEETGGARLSRRDEPAGQGPGVGGVTEDELDSERLLRPLWERRGPG